MNVVINASEAIGDKGGIINVSTAQVSDSVNLASISATGLSPGDYVRLEVSDNGCGMTENAESEDLRSVLQHEIRGPRPGSGRRTRDRPRTWW